MLLLQILNTFLPVAYALLAFEYGRRLMRGGAEGKPPLAAAAALAAVHLIGTALRGVVLDHCPCVTGTEVVSLLALSMVLVHVILERIVGLRGTGFFVIGIAFILQFFASALNARIQRVEIIDAYRTWQSAVHVHLAILGYAGFAIAGAHGVVYLVLYKLIRGRNYGPVFQRLPSLDVLDRLLGAAVVTGLVFFTFGIISGALNAARLPQSRPPWPAVTAGVTWIVFAALLALRRRPAWKGRRSAWVAIGGLAIACVGLLLSESLHKLVSG
ncbi:MAG: cytochrome c biogenesis protein CcsA [Planctomycetes bacterium]|nr:cytochrome c biogenesis protein CcsA [Planctomycetota bacterium]